MNIVLYIVLPVAGIVLGWIIRWIYARFQLTASEQKAERVKQDAIREAEAQKKEILLNAKDELIRERNQQERENRERRAEVQRFEARVNKKEELLDQRAAEFEKNEKELADKKAAMVKREEELSKQEELYRQELEKISGLSQQEAKDLIIKNLVFMQFNRKADGHLEPLPSKNIDTGMGFERLCMVLQGKRSNYETDVFSGLIGELENLSGHKYGKENDKVDVAMRVCADHIRAIAFSIADGQLPSNVKAGYVIRRILRRAVRYGYTFLGFDKPFLCLLIDRLCADMGGAYPELNAQKKLIESVIREEENAFLRTLDRGIRMLDDLMAKSEGTISGTDAFTLYDTYGFPVDLTELIAAEKNFKVDLDGFAVEMEKQKNRARNATANEFGDWTEFSGASDAEVSFTGYDTVEESGCHLLKHRTVKQKNKELLQLVFDRTPFYAEMGGQVGDTGTATSASGEEIKILNTVKENNLTIHIADRIPQDCEGTFTLKVDAERRARITANHTATHLMDQALREVLGTHVEQKGSFVCPDYLRFDFSHFSKMTEEEIEKVEKRVNQLIRSNFPLQEKRDATMDEAKAMGALALFGEKYGDRVRVVKFGPSAELCGGTHASATGNIGFFKIVSEGAVAAGVRRIEAVTGEAAETLVRTIQNTLQAAKSFFNNAPDLTGAIHKLVEENAGFKKEIEDFMAEKTAQLAKKLMENAEQAGDIKIIRMELSADPAMVRGAATLLQKELKGTALAGAFQWEDKPQLILMYSQDLVAAGRNAGKDIREAAKFIQGGGGGQPGLAMAGGKNVEGLKDAMEALVNIVKG